MSGALSGEHIQTYTEGEDGRVYTLIEPVIARENYQGVNCLGCHQAKEGQVLGAIRVDYSMADSDVRLRRLHDRMDEISRNSDLNIELDVHRNDEAGSVSLAFNRMMARIRESMNTVLDNAECVEQAAKSISVKAETTEMVASAVQVRENAIHTTQKSLATVE